MIHTIREFFAARIGSEEREESSLQLATAALLIEVSRADFDVSEAERFAIVEQVQKSFGISEEET
ncbi:MAG TPA: TerB family tellurite resistance protein, partial [Vicinamibacteria bacterium]